MSFLIDFAHRIPVALLESREILDFCVESFVEFFNFIELSLEGLQQLQPFFNAH